MAMKRSQSSIENLILVGIVIAIIIPSIIVYYRAHANPEAQALEVMNAGNSLLGQVKNFKQMSEDSWQTVDISYTGSKGRIITSGLNEFSIETNQGSYPFFVGKDERVVIEPDLQLKPGKNRIKLSTKNGIVCVSSQMGTCDFDICPDHDKDGFTTCDGDCNDNDPLIFPGAPEICDKTDNNCDFRIDEPFDKDQDGFPDRQYNNPDSGCQGHYGSANSAYDCNDSNVLVYPNAPEQCDGIDNNCNGAIDEDLLVTKCADHGFFGRCGEGHYSCTGGRWTCDTQPVHEICGNGIDDDCDGLPDDTDPDCETLFFADFNKAGDPAAYYYGDICRGSCACIDCDGLSLSNEGIDNTSVIIVGRDLPGIPESRLRYAGIGNIDALKGTIEFWVRPYGQNIWTDGYTRTFFHANETGGTGYVDISKQLTGLPLRPRIAVSFSKEGIPNAPLYANYTDSWDPASWRLITVTWDLVSEPKLLKVYVNGAFVGQSTLSNAIWPSSIDTFAIGASLGQGSMQYRDHANATFDNLNITRNVKTAEEIKGTYQAYWCGYNDLCNAPGGFGDINRNGCIDGDDKTLLLRYLQGTYFPDAATVACMDVHHDCQIDQLDYDALIPAYCMNCVTHPGECYEQGASDLFCNLQGIWEFRCGDPNNCGCPPSRPICPAGGGMCTSGGSSPLIFKGNGNAETG